MLYKCNVCGNRRYFVLSGIVVTADVDVDDSGIKVVVDNRDCQMAAESIIYDDPDNAKIKCICGNDFLWRDYGDNISRK